MVDAHCPICKSDGYDAVRKICAVCQRNKAASDEVWTMFEQLRECGRRSASFMLDTYRATGMPAFDPTTMPELPRSALQMVYDWQEKALTAEMHQRGIVMKRGGLDILLHPKGDVARQRMNELLNYQVDRIKLSFARKRGRKRTINREALTGMMRELERFVDAVRSRMEVLAREVAPPERRIRRRIHAQGQAHLLVEQLTNGNPLLMKEKPGLLNEIRDLLIAQGLTTRGRAVAILAAVTGLSKSTVSQYTLQTHKN